jgi:hypothetical protein
MKLTRKKVIYKCGHQKGTIMLVNNLTESMEQRKNTRCIKCFNTKSLIPSN